MNSTFIAAFSVVFLFVRISRCEQDVSDVVVEGNRYRQENSSCTYTPVEPSYRANCTTCLSLTDCAVECSLQDFGGDDGETYTKCVGFAAKKATSGTSFTTCTLVNKLNCTKRRPGPSGRLTYYRKIEKMNSDNNNYDYYSETSDFPKKLPQRQKSRKFKIDAFDPHLCGAGKLRDLYDPFSGRVGKIVGGYDAERGEFPFQVLLTMTYVHPDDDEERSVLCAGSLIDREWILSAGHCFPPRVLQSTKKMVNASLGRYYLFTKEKFKSVILARDQDNSKIFVNPNYKDGEFIYDFTLIRIPKPLTQFTESMSPVCLPQIPVPNYDDKIVVTPGWGWSYWERHTNPDSGSARTMFDPLGDIFKTDDEKKLENSRIPNESREGTPAAAHPDILQKLPRRLLTDEECINELEDDGFDPEVMICTSKSGHRDQCQGDSGGPWVAVDRPFGDKNSGSRWFQVGLTSWGRDCGTGVGVGARINDNVIRWIKDITTSQTH